MKTSLRSPGSGEREKTARRSDFLPRLLNTLFNPFAREDILYPPDSTPWTRAVYHAGGLAIGYGGLGVVLRKLVQTQQKSTTQETLQKLRAFSSARNPTVSIDPHLDDAEQEKELENLGLPELPHLKAAADPTSAIPFYGGSAAATSVNPILNPLGRELRGKHDPAHLALAAAAVIAAGYGGWRLQDYINDRNTEEGIEDRIAKTKNLIDKMVFKEVERTRGLRKAAAFSAVSFCLEKESQGLSPDDLPSADEKKHGLWGSARGVLNPFSGAALRGIETLWWVWAAAAFALSYGAARKFADKVDPNRKRLTEIESLAEDRSRVYEAPVLLDESSFSSIPPLASRPESSAQRVPAAVPVEGVKTKTPVDAMDPYASILQ
jgi:hypothetical protein